MWPALAVRLPWHAAPAGLRGCEVGTTGRRVGFRARTAFHRPPILAEGSSLESKSRALQGLMVRGRRSRTVSGHVGQQHCDCHPSRRVGMTFLMKQNKPPRPNQRRLVAICGWRHVACARCRASDRAVPLGVVPVAVPRANLRALYPYK